MPGGQTHFHTSWLSATDCNNQTIGVWCSKGKDDYHGHCRFCDCDIKCDNSGKAQLLQHAEKQKHLQSIKHLLDKKQTRLAFKSEEVPSNSQGNASQTLTLINHKDASLAAEVIWLAKMAACNFSLRSIDHIGETFKAMFPDSKFAAQFSMSRSKASYVIGEGLGPHFRRVVIDDVAQSRVPFSMHFDETTTSQVKKQMDLTLRYWSNTHQEVYVAFYTSLFFGHATGEIVAKKIFDQMKADQLPMEQLITLVRDGPNVNKTIVNKLQEKIKEEKPEFNGFVDLGSCVLHVVHNAFGKGLEQNGKDIDQFCLDLHALFKYSAARRESYREVQHELEVEVHNFQQHTEVRWVSLGPAIKRVIEQWDAICVFVTDLGKDAKSVPKSINYRRVATMLSGVQKGVTKVTLEFLNNVTALFEEFLTACQNSGPQIHVLYDRICELLLKLMGRCLKQTAIKNAYGKDLVAIDCKDVKNQLPDQELVVGDEARRSLSSLDANRKKAVILGIRAFFTASISYLQAKLPLENGLLRELCCLNPRRRQRKSTLAYIQAISRKLQPQVDVSHVADEWKMYQADDIVEELDASESADHYWNKVFSAQAPDGTMKYIHLPQVVKSGLVLAQTNADSERSLSINARIVTKERCALNECTITGLRSVKEAVRFYDPQNGAPQKIPITPALKQAVRTSHAAYVARLEEEKKTELKRVQEEQAKKEDKERLERERKELCETKQNLAKKEEILNNEENEAKNAIEVADQLIDDASTKLQKALGKTTVDKKSVQVAYVMMNVAKEKGEVAKRKMTEIREKQKSIEKQKQKLIDKAIPSVANIQTKRKASSETEGVPKKKKKK